MNNQQFFDVFVTLLLTDGNTEPLRSIVDGIDVDNMLFASTASELFADEAVATVLENVTPELAYEAVAAALPLRLHKYGFDAAEAVAGRWATMQAVADAWDLSTAKLNAAVRSARRNVGAAAVAVKVAVAV